ncbi:MAG: hypothetical protein ABSG78_18490 [Verrucomicrobiota bacterium]|jgi:hypothetical protein
MNRRSPNSSAGRRQFLRDGLRFAILGGLAAVIGRLAGREAARPAGQVCISAGICRGCAAFEDCGLPNALSAKEALGQSRSRQL